MHKVPVCSYDDLWHQYWQKQFPHTANATFPGKVTYFALSSGTTSGRTKYLPLTRSMINANRATALEVMAWHQHHNPSFGPFSGPLLYLGGSTTLQPLHTNIYAGDLSAIALKLRPLWAASWLAPPMAISGISSWEKRLEALLDYLAQPRAIQVISGVPMWIHKLMSEVRQRGLPGLDKLRLIIHGGAPIDPYLQQLKSLLPPGCARREVYPASEGFIAFDATDAADWNAPRSLRLNTNNRGLFFEFIDPDEADKPHPRRYWIGNAEIGKAYVVVVTTNAGLWSYRLGDVVRLVRRDPPEIVFVGRTAWYISHFGEHLAYSDIDQAVREAACGTNQPITEWCFGMKEQFIHGQRCGQHILIIETTRSLVPTFAKMFDSHLLYTNSDYAEARTTPFIPRPPQVMALTSGAFDRLLVAMGKGGGQSKVPRVIHDLERFAQMLALIPQQDKYS